jgi:hypothetical protein
MRTAFMLFSGIVVAVALLPVGAATPHQSDSSPIATPNQTLIVQVVDPVWSAVPGARVSVNAESSKAAPHSALTDANGYANFFLPGDADCTITVSRSGFKNQRMKALRIFRPSGNHSTAYVQLRLRFSGRPIVVN